MNIKQEDFDKLKQLDRIEYRQKEERIKSWGVNLSSALPYFSFTLIVCLSMTIVVNRYNPSKTGYFISFLGFLCLFCGLAYFIVFALEIMCGAIKKRNLDELRDDYFKIEVKK